MRIASPVKRPQRATLPLFMLAFDHRRSIRGLFGISGEPTSSESSRISDAKRVIFEGLMQARGELEGVGMPGLLVDQRFGAEVLELARRQPIVAAVACERSGQAEFEFEYGNDFAAHVERFDPELVKALVRFNPDGDPDLNRRQVERLRRLTDWLRGSNRELLFELLVPATPEQLRSVRDDRNRFDLELRPELVCRAVAELQDQGIEPAVWKIEGLDRRSHCEQVAAVCRRRGRDHVSCLVLGRGAADPRVEHWLRVAAPIEGFGGFAVGRTIWWQPIGSYLAGELDRGATTAAIAKRYKHFVNVYREAEGHPLDR
jgi:myo-inositol catabolism protein IolC